MGEFLNVSGFLEESVRADSVKAASGDAMWVGPADAFCRCAVDGVAEELLTLVDVGLPVQTCVGVKEHARATVAETVAVERGHECGHGMAWSSWYRTGERPRLRGRSVRSVALRCGGGARGEGERFRSVLRVAPVCGGGGQEKIERLGKSEQNDRTQPARQGMRPQVLDAEQDQRQEEKQRLRWKKGHEGSVRERESPPRLHASGVEKLTSGGGGEDTEGVVCRWLLGGVLALLAPTPPIVGDDWEPRL